MAKPVSSIERSGEQFSNCKVHPDNFGYVEDFNGVQVLNEPQKLISD